MYQQIKTITINRPEQVVKLGEKDMKKETLQARIDAMRCKNGVLNNVDVLERLLINGIFHGKEWRRDGRHISLSDCRYYAAINFCDKLGIDYELGNDAPRGGKEGDFIKLTAKGKRQVAEWVKAKKAEIDARKEQEELERLEREKIEQEKKDEYARHCEETYNQLVATGATFTLQDEDKNYTSLPFVRCREGEVTYINISKRAFHRIAGELKVYNNDGFKAYAREFILKNYK